MLKMISVKCGHNHLFIYVSNMYNVMELNDPQIIKDIFQIVKNKDNWKLDVITYLRNLVNITETPEWIKLDWTDCEIEMNSRGWIHEITNSMMGTQICNCNKSIALGKIMEAYSDIFEE